MDISLWQRNYSFKCLSHFFLKLPVIVDKYVFGLLGFVSYKKLEDEKHHKIKRKDLTQHNKTIMVIKQEKKPTQEFLFLKQMTPIAIIKVVMQMLNQRETTR